jgi:hypothetical protein
MEGSSFSSFPYVNVTPQGCTNTLGLAEEKAGGARSKQIALSSDSGSFFTNFAEEGLPAR